MFSPFWATILTHSVAIQQNTIMKRYAESVDEVFSKRCEYPYECEERTGPAFPCLLGKGESPERFFGHPTIDVGDGDLVFADLAWSMQTEVIVRDGKELRPPTDYIDSKTVDVELIIPFFAPLDKVPSFPPPLNAMFINFGKKNECCVVQCLQDYRQRY